ncbi:MAG: peptidoglycan DD-metalloendopeptidase family protein [Longimicrobiales bacterium]
MSRSPLQNPWTFLGLAGALVLALLVGNRMAADPPEVGPLAPILAPAAELFQEVTLRPGQTFGEVLQAASVGWSDQNALLLAFREQANPRRMKDGTRITLRWLRDPERLRGIDVDLSKDETIRLLRDEVGWSSFMENTPVRVDTIFVRGVVRSSLWNAMDSNEDLAGIHPVDRRKLIDWMDQVFQWQIDFSRQVRTGDTYRAVLEVELRPDGSLRRGHILAAEYANQGTSYFAIWFDPNGDGEGTYYDELGKSVRKAFLMKPLEFRRISSGVNPSRLHPIHRYRRPHNGVDYAANVGTPIMATGDGAVVYADWKGELGNLVEIRHPNGWLTRYGHMSRYAAGIRPGTRVKQGQIIGYVGQTGGATGPHLHYEMRKSDGSVLDPLRVRLPPGDPIPDGSFAQWALDSRTRLKMLETLGAPIAVLAEAPESPAATEGAATGGD